MLGKVAQNHCSLTIGMNDLQEGMTFFFWLFHSNTFQWIEIPISIENVVKSTEFGGVLFSALPMWQQCLLEVFRDNLNFLSFL